MKHPPIVSAVMRATCEAYGVTVPQSRHGRCLAQQVSAYLIRRITGRSYAWIGRNVGGVSHSAVLAWCRRLEWERLISHEFRALVERLEEQVATRRVA